MGSDFSREETPEWSSTSDYYQGDVVLYNGRKYQCIKTFYGYRYSNRSINLIENPENNFMYWLRI